MSSRTYPTPVGMPAPLDPDPADGADAFGDFITAAKANLTPVPAWSTDVVTRTYSGEVYQNTAALTPGAGWTLVSCYAMRLNHLIVINATLTTSAGITFGATGYLAVASTVCTIVPTALRPTAGPTYCMDARIAETQVQLEIGSGTPDKIALLAAANPSRTVAAGSTLSFHTQFFDGIADRTV